MDKMLETLEAYGADIEGAMGRFLDDVGLYKTCFTTFLKDEAFEKLGKALDEHDYEKAFENAHTLKGITGNMALTPLYKLICEIVEKLRNKKYDGLEELYQAIMEQLKTLKKLEG